MRAPCSQICSATTSSGSRPAACGCAGRPPATPRPFSARRRPGGGRGRWPAPRPAGAGERGCVHRGAPRRQRRGTGLPSPCASGRGRGAPSGSSASAPPPETRRPALRLARPSFRGDGLMSEAAGAVVQAWFAWAGGTRLDAQVRGDAPPARRVLEKAGFVPAEADRLRLDRGRWLSGAADERPCPGGGGMRYGGRAAAGGPPATTRRCREISRRSQGLHPLR